MSCAEVQSRIDELLAHQTRWLNQNPGSFLHLNDPRNAGRWALMFPDEAEELAELLEAANP